jgi:glycyl-tRNA synthetase beta chain
VIGGRLDDALFFWNEDRRAPLAERREELSGVVFHKELGTYAEKTLRTSRLAARIAETLGLEEGARAALGRAAELARCDLVTGLVGEFPELQGVVGGLLARADGEPEDAWRAIYDLYRPAGVEDALPATRLGLVLGLADRLDSLAGGFAVGLEPSGSSDPFALRRAGLGVVRLASALGDLRLAPLVESAFEGYAGGEAGPDLRARREESAPRLEGFLVERLAAIAERAGARYDELAALRAVALDDGFVPADLLRRLEALRALRGSDDFLALAAAAKRVRNILGQAQERGDVAAAGALAERLSEPAELELADAVAGTELRVREARGRGDHEEALRAVAALRPEVDRFFDEIMVMAEDDGLRRARLGLIARIHSLAHETVDLAEIVVEGHERRTKSAARARGAEKGAGGR